MIAPLREWNTVARRPRRLGGAHQFLAATLLESSAEDRGPAVARWKAWALVGWMIFAVAFYAGSMLRWW